MQCYFIWLICRDLYSIHVSTFNTVFECPVLPVFANGMIVYATDVTPDFDLGTTATYSCNDGYTLAIGDEVRTCIDEGENDAVGVSSGHAPACVRKYNALFYRNIPNSFLYWAMNPTKVIGAQQCTEEYLPLVLSPYYIYTEKVIHELFLVSPVAPPPVRSVLFQLRLTNINNCPDWVVSATIIQTINYASVRMRKRGIR